MMKFMWLHKKKFHVKVVKVGFDTATVKFATTKVQRKKSFTVGCWLSDDYGEGTGEVFQSR